MTSLPPDAELALRFVNTLRHGASGPTDRLASVEAVRRWLEEEVGPRLPDTSEQLRAPSTARLVAEEAHRLRDAARVLLRARAEGAEPPPAAVFQLDRVLGAARLAVRVVPHAHGVRVRTDYELGSPIGILAPIAHALARLLQSVEPARLRPCAAAGCPEWFVDTSKGGRRRWCSMATCGNRRKAARHRARETG